MIHFAGYPAREVAHPAAVAPLVHREPDVVLPPAEFERPWLARKAEVIVVAAGPAGEFALRPDGKSLPQALGKRLLDGTWHCDFDHIGRLRLAPNCSPLRRQPGTESVPGWRGCAAGAIRRCCQTPTGNPASASVSARSDSSRSCIAPAMYSP